MIVVVILFIAVVVGVCFGFAALSNKITNKVNRTIMQQTGLGNKMNENFDRLNAGALKKLDTMLAEGKITQEQYDRRKKNLMSDFDFNK